MPASSVYTMPTEALVTSLWFSGGGMMDTAVLQKVQPCGMQCGRRRISLLLLLLLLLLLMPPIEWRFGSVWQSVWIH
jgi:hypothetical protein